MWRRGNITMTLDSIYYFRPGHFMDYIRRIINKSITVSDAIATFREIKCLPGRFKQMTIQELADNPKVIQELYKVLREGMRPESKSRLPYKKEERERELIKNMAENYDVDIHKTRAKIITGHYDDGLQAFNYILEVVAAPKKDSRVIHAGEVEFIGNINSTPSIDGGEGYFQDANFQWTDKKGMQVSASGIRGLFHECGFNTSGYYTSKKKKPAVFLVNLRTPCPDWLGSAGKTKIDLRPYAYDIAKVVSGLARNIPSYHGEGYTSSNYTTGSIKDEEQVAINYLVDFLKNRYNAIRQDASIKRSDRITQSGVWYRIRPIMLASGFIPCNDWGTTRRYITGKINQICRELFGLDREDLGIIASARAVMYYEGKSYPVNIDNLEELARKGIAIIIIEKEGIADLLVPYADRYKIALVFTRGRFTEYGKDLIESAKKSGSVIGILVDYDAYGEDIARGSRTETPRIGINLETIRWLQENGYPDLRMGDVEEDYKPDINTDYEYLKYKRIELDSVAAKVGAEGLWKYIMYRLQLKELAPAGFDYNRVKSMPAKQILYPLEVKALLSAFNEYFDKVIEDDVQEIESDLSHVTNLVEVQQKETEIKERLDHKISENVDVKLLSEASKLTKLVKNLVAKLE
jgi:hypothetical protein